MIDNEPKKSTFADFIKNPFTQLVGVLTGVTLIFGIGYAIGQFREGISSDVQK